MNMQSEAKNPVSKVKSHDESNIFENNENEQVESTTSLHEDKSNEVNTGLKNESLKSLECTSGNENYVSGIKNAQKSQQNLKEKVNDSTGNVEFANVIQDEEQNASFSDANESFDVIQEEPNAYFIDASESFNVIQEEQRASINFIQKEQQNASFVVSLEEEPNSSFDVIPDENASENDIQEGEQIMLHQSEESLFRNLHLFMNQVDENCERENIHHD